MRSCHKYCLGLTANLSSRFCSEWLSVSVWASDFGLSLGQVACAEKSNEITAIPAVLQLVDMTGAIITIDAMGTQKAIAKQIVDGKGDYVLVSSGTEVAEALERLRDETTER